MENSSTIINNAFADILSPDQQSQKLASGDIPYPDAPEGKDSSRDLGNLKTIDVGYGEKSLHMDEQGFWLGAQRFLESFFRIDMQGRMYLQSKNGTIVIDTVNNNITIQDEEGKSRVLFGFQKGGF